jgi:hypothetical protein
LPLFCGHAGHNSTVGIKLGSPDTAHECAMLKVRREHHVQVLEKRRANGVLSLVLLRTFPPDHKEERQKASCYSRLDNLSEERTARTSHGFMIHEYVGQTLGTDRR